jgi:hypothetical protein
MSKNKHPSPPSASASADATPIMPAQTMTDRAAVVITDDDDPLAGRIVHDPGQQDLSQAGVPVPAGAPHFADHPNVDRDARADDRGTIDHPIVGHFTIGERIYLTVGDPTGRVGSCRAVASVGSDLAIVPERATTASELRAVTRYFDGIRADLGAEISGDAAPPTTGRNPDPEVFTDIPEDRGHIPVSPIFQNPYAGKNNLQEINDQAERQAFGKDPKGPQKIEKCPHCHMPVEVRIKATHKPSRDDRQYSVVKYGQCTRCQKSIGMGFGHDGAILNAWRT